MRKCVHSWYLLGLCRVLYSAYCYYRQPEMGRTIVPRRCLFACGPIANSPGSKRKGSVLQGYRRLRELLGIRDAVMADNVAYMAARERGRGSVLAFAHNRHMRRSQVE